MQTDISKQTWSLLGPELAVQHGQSPSETRRSVGVRGADRAGARDGCGTARRVAPCLTSTTPASAPAHSDTAMSFASSSAPTPARLLSALEAQLAAGGGSAPAPGSWAEMQLRMGLAQLQTLLRSRASEADERVRTARLEKVLAGSVSGLWAAPRQAGPGECNLPGAEQCGQARWARGAGCTEQRREGPVLPLHVLRDCLSARMIPSRPQTASLALSRALMGSTSDPLSSDIDTGAQHSTSPEPLAVRCIRALSQRWKQRAWQPARDSRISARRAVRLRVGREHQRL
jgi:hypothetical protein